MEYSQFAFDEQRITITAGRAAKLGVSRLRMTAAVHYECSLLCMMIASVLAELPVAGFERDDLRPGRSLVDLYCALDVVAAQFRAVCNEILHVCYMSNITGGFYGSGGTISLLDLRDANVNLLRITRHARELSVSLASLFKPDAPALDLLKGVAHIFPCIVIVQDFLAVTLRAPDVLPAEADASRSSAERLGLIEPPEIFDNIGALFFGRDLGPMMLGDYNRLARDVDDYRKILRSRIG